MGQPVAERAPWLADVHALGKVLGVCEPGRHNDDVGVVDQAIVDHERLQLSEKEPLLLGDSAFWVHRRALDRVMKRLEVEPDDPAVRDARHDCGLLSVRRDYEQPVIAVVSKVGEMLR